MTVKERLQEFLRYKNISQSKFEKTVGLGNGYVNSIRSSVSPTKLQQISLCFPELNKAWLLTGEGNMLYPRSENNEVHYIEILPVSAQGGTLSDFANSVGKHECEKMLSPVKGADFVIPVAGDSMSPEYPSGSKVIIKRINERAFIDWGRVYVLDTCNGTIIKKILPGSDADRVRCVSFNANYPDFEVAYADIYGFYRVLLLLSEK